MEEYLKDICAPHFWPIVITIGAMFILMGSGVAIRPLLKKLFDAVIKRVSGESVEVVVNPGGTGGEMAQQNPTICEGCNLYKKCRMHGTRESESKANKEKIEYVNHRVDILWAAHEELAKEMRGSFLRVQETMASSERTILANQSLILAAVKGGGK